MKGTSLAYVLPKEAIDAAGRIREKMPQWQGSDKALAALSEKFPDFGSVSTLLKAVAINALYSTNVFAIERMAQWIVKVIKKHAGSLKDPELVEQIARLPKTDDQKRDRRHYSFASKFAHFFVDPEAFPIRDSYAVSMMKHHLGKKNMEEDDSWQYVAYVRNYERLKECLGYEVTNQELDRYLWIAGELKTYMKNENALINSSLRDLLRNGLKNTSEYKVLHEIVGVNRS